MTEIDYDIWDVVKRLDGRIDALEQTALDRARNSNASAIAFSDRLDVLEEWMKAGPGPMQRSYAMNQRLDRLETVMKETGLTWGKFWKLQDTVHDNVGRLDALAERVKESVDVLISEVETLSGDIELPSLTIKMLSERVAREHGALAERVDKFTQAEAIHHTIATDKLDALAEKQANLWADTIAMVNGLAQRVNKMELAATEKHDMLAERVAKLEKGLDDTDLITSKRCCTLENRVAELERLAGFRDELVGERLPLAKGEKT